MNKKNVLVMAVAMLLVAMISVGGTIAWLTATSGDVTNTFTVGDITIELKETEVDDNGDKVENGDLVTANTYKIIPGDTVSKDPMVIVGSTSEKCYVFVLLTNNLIVGNNEVATWAVGSDWTLIGQKDNQYLYSYSEEMSAGETSDPVITTVTIAGTVTEEDIETLKDKTIVATAYAHQSENTDLATAKAAAIAFYGVTAVSGD